MHGKGGATHQSNHHHHQDKARFISVGSDTRALQSRTRTASIAVLYPISPFILFVVPGVGKNSKCSMILSSDRRIRQIIIKCRQRQPVCEITSPLFVRTNVAQFIIFREDLSKRESILCVAPHRMELQMQ